MDIDTGESESLSKECKTSLITKSKWFLCGS